MQCIKINKPLVICYVMMIIHLYQRRVLWLTLSFADLVDANTMKLERKKMT